MNENVQVWFGHYVMKESWIEVKWVHFTSLLAYPGMNAFSNIRWKKYMCLIYDDISVSFSVVTELNGKELN